MHSHCQDTDKQIGASFVLFVTCVCRALASVHGWLVVAWGMPLVCDVCCGFVAFPFGILGQVWYLIASVPDPCCLSLIN